MKKLPPLNSLKIFILASRFESYALAAQNIHITKGAISQHIKRLEDSFGFEVFHKTNSGIKLTSKGAKLLEVASESFNAIQTVCSELTQDKPAKIHIACSHSLLNYEFIAYLMKQSPELADLILITQDTSLESLLNFQIDILITSENNQINQNSSIKSTTLFQDEIALICNEYTLNKLENNQPVNLINCDSRYNAWDNWLENDGYKADINDYIQIEKLYLAIDAVKAGIGITIAPKCLVEKSIYNGSLHAPYGFVEANTPTKIYTRLSEGDPYKELIEHIKYFLMEAPSF